MPCSGRTCQEPDHRALPGDPCAARLGGGAGAISLRPYIPGAVDFERTLPDAKRLDQTAKLRVGRARTASPPPAGSRRRSAPRTASTWSGWRRRCEIEIRVRDNGGEWSDWVPQDDATPIYVDGADEAQVRAPFKPDGELHFVNVSGTSGGDRWTGCSRPRASRSTRPSSRSPPPQ